MSINQFTVFILATAALLSACAQIPQAQKSNYEGNAAYYSRRYDDALTKYEDAFKSAEKTGDKQYEAIAMFGLARTYAQLCQEEDSEKWFKQSISAREVLPDITHAHVTQNLLEYARFLASWRRISEALTLYDRAMPLLESLGMEKEDPIGYAFVFDEYEALLTSVGRTSDAVVAANRAKSLRETYKDRRPQFKPEPYPNCEGKTQK